MQPVQTGGGARAAHRSHTYSRPVQSPLSDPLILMTDVDASPQETGLLVRLGIHRPELRAWVMYAWANSAMVTTVVAAVFPIFYSRVAAANLPDGEATFRFSIITTIALAVVAILAPILGAVADFSASKKRMLAAFMTIGALSVAGMVFIR